MANHFNGFVDPILITAALGRTPRFIASDCERIHPGRVARMPGTTAQEGQADHPDS